MGIFDWFCNSTNDAPTGTSEWQVDDLEQAKAMNQAGEKVTLSAKNDADYYAAVAEGIQVTPPKHD